ncbi:hypothetical protein ACIOWK_34700 [Pseudomonas protegens]|uniref:hypothetical protein n=1 Tax=Pseudomonas protegens TaxID=380021 RepID=UPI00382BF56B
MAGIPKRRGEVVSDERVTLEDELYRTYVVDEMSIARLSSEIRRLLDGGSYTGLEMAVLYIELAYLHSYKRDDTKSVACLRSAESLGADQFVVALAESSVKLMVGKLSEAVKSLERVDVSKLTADQVGLLMAQASAIGALDLVQHLMPAGVESDAGEALEILNECGATVSDLILRLDAAAQFIAKEVSHPLLGYKRIVMGSEDCLMYRFGVRMSPEDVAELNTKIIRFMVERFDEPIDCVVSIGAMPFKPERRDDSWRTYNAGV